MVPAGVEPPPHGSSVLGQTAVSVTDASDPASGRVRVLFLGGLGRSGTTLVERVLGELPGAFPLGEVVHLWSRDVKANERCGCGRPFHDCPFWSEVGQVAFGGWDALDVDRVIDLAARVDRTRYIPRYSAEAVHALNDRTRAELAEYTSYYVRLYRAAQQVSGAQVLIDSSKHSSLAYCLSHASHAGPDGGLDLRLLHVVRDSRGVAYSWTKHVERPEADGDEMARFSPFKSALLWDAHNVAFDLLRRRHPESVSRLRYEQFVADPVGSVRSVAAFAGLEPGEAGLAFLEPGAAELAACHSAAGNPMRFTTGRVQLRRDEAWRQAMPSGQRRLVSGLTAPLLRAYGYSLDGAGS